MKYEIESDSTHSAIAAVMDNEENTAIEKSDFNFNKVSMQVMKPPDLDHKKNWWIQAMARHQKWINAGGFHQLRNAILPQSKRSSALPAMQTVDAKQSLEKQNDNDIENAIK